MESIRTFLNQPWIGSTAGLIGVFVGILGIILYVRSRQRKRLCIQKYALRIIGRGDTEVSEDIEILYQSTVVHRLTKTTVVFWNAGTETIDGNDIVDRDPIRFVFSDESTILRAKIITRTRDVNEASIRLDQEGKNAALLDFEFLDPSDGVRIEFLHTDAKRFPTVNGTVKGVSQGIVDTGGALEDISGPALNMFMYSIVRRQTIILYAALGLGSVIAAAGVLPDAVYEYFGVSAPGEEDDPNALSERVGMIIAGMLYAALGGVVLWMGRRRYPKGLMEFRGQ